MLWSKKKVVENIKPTVEEQCNIDGYGTFYLVKGGKDITARLNTITELGAEVASAQDIALGRLNLEDDLNTYVKQPLNYNSGMISDKIIYLPAKITRNKELTLLVKNCKYDDASIQNMKSAHPNYPEDVLTVEKFFKEHTSGEDYLLLDDSLANLVGSLGPIPTNNFNNYWATRLLFAKQNEYGHKLNKHKISNISIDFSYPYIESYLDQEIIKVIPLYMLRTLTEEVKSCNIVNKFVDKSNKSEFRNIMITSDDFGAVFAIKRDN